MEYSIRQPNSKMCFLCGMENVAGLKLRFFTNDSGEVEVQWTPPAQYQGYPGILHGGIIAALLDETAGRTIIGGTEPRFMATMKMEIKYRKPVPVLRPLRVVGRLLRDRGKIAETEGFLYLEGGVLAVEAKVWIAAAPKEFVPENSEEKLGWKVYE